jgi:hypothetical protein
MGVETSGLDASGKGHFMSEQIQPTSKHPIDYDALQKGDYITPDVCEAILKLTRDTKRYPLRLTSLAQHIERELRIRGRPATVACRKDGISILTDSEAARHSVKWREQRVRGIRRDLRRLVNVDVNHLSDCEKQDHDRELLVTGRMVQMIRTARKSLPAPEPHKRIE